MRAAWRHLLCATMRSQTHVLGRTSITVSAAAGAEECYTAALAIFHEETDHAS